MPWTLEIKDKVSVKYLNGEGYIITSKVTGIAIMGFKKRTEGLKDVKVSLPTEIQLSS